VSGYDISTLDMQALNEAYRKAVESGELHQTDAGWNTLEPQLDRWLSKGGENANHIHGINARDSEQKSRLEIEARKSFLRLYRFLKRQPGLENLRVEHLCPECGVRETATIVGETTVTEKDYESGRVWSDSLCYSFYNIDLHCSSGRGINGRALPKGTVPTIPRGALIPKGSTNMLAAGRCISSDRMANSALRVEASAMAIGQAAGALAALAAASGAAVGELRIADVHELLRKHNAIVPDVKNAV
jgi:hypothetical protein